MNYDGGIFVPTCKLTLRDFILTSRADKELWGRFVLESAYVKIIPKLSKGDNPMVSVYCNSSSPNVLYPSCFWSAKAL